MANAGAGSKAGQNSSGGETNGLTPHTVTYNLGPLNRLSVVDTAGGTTTYGAASGMNQYPAVGGLPLTYDTNFNLASYNGWSYVFDAAGQLTSASASGHTASFVYDGLGRCVQRTIDGVVATITYDGWKPIYEWSSTGGQIAWNLYGPGPDEILWRNQAGGVGDLHYQTDHEGSVYFIRGPANAVREQYTYDAFGKPAIFDSSGNSITDSLIGNRFMFTGREYLTTLGIYDYRHRMYHPVLDRFLEVDPKGFDAGDYNLYRYCYNDPMDRIDPMGMESPGGAAERAAEIERNHNGIFDVDNASGLHSGTTGSSIVTSAGLAANWGSNIGAFAQTEVSKSGGGKQSFEQRARGDAVKMLAEETHRPNVTQTGVITDGPPYRVGPVDEKIGHREPGNPESLRVAREELKWKGPEHQKIMMVHYHDRSLGLGLPTQDHDIQMLKMGPMYFTNRDWATTGKYEILRQSQAPEVHFDKSLIP